MTAFVCVSAWISGVDFDRLRETEVEHLHERHSVDAARDEEILRLDVAVDDPERVGLGDPFDGLKDVVNGLGGAPRAALGDELSEVLPHEELHDHVGPPPSSLPTSIDPDAVLALQLHRSARLAEKALDRLFVSRGLAAQQLQGKARLELDVPRRDDDPHPPHPKHPLDAVLPAEHVTRLDGRFGVEEGGHRTIARGRGTTRPRKAARRLECQQ